MPTCTAITNTQAVELTAGTLTSGFCHETLQLTFEEFISKTTGQLEGNMAAFTAGDDTPSGDDQDKLWFKQDGSGGADCVPVDGGWHWYNVNAAPAAWEAVQATTTSPVGTIVQYVAAAAPTGWLLCDGEVADASTYPTLNTLLGTTYGTQGQTPDLQCRIPIGKGTASGLTTRALNDIGGIEDFTLAEANLPEHTHYTAGATNVANFSTAVAGRPIPWYNTSSGNWQMHMGSGVAETPTLGTTDAFGASSPTELNNMPPFITVNFIIRALI